MLATLGGWAGTVSVALALAVIAAAPVRAQGESICGPPDRPYACGRILVILEADTQDAIADVMARQGGTADDLVETFTAVRDLLNDGGVAIDTSAATVYQIAVEVGREEASAAAYAADSAVYAAAVDRHTIGTVTPDTSMNRPTDRTIGTLASIAAALIGGTLAVFRAQRHWSTTIGRRRP